MDKPTFLERLRLRAAGLLGEPPPGRPRLTVRQFLAEIAAKAASTDEHELTCDECFELLDRYAELAIQGEDVAALLPEVEKHLAICGDCLEEYEVLVRIVRSNGMRNGGRRRER